MKSLQCTAVVVGLSLAALVLVQVEAHGQGISVSRAEVQKGLALVRGKAAPGAPLTWDSRAVATATATGSYSFKAPIPADCSGTLSDGGVSVEVAVVGCTPRTLRTGQTKCYGPGGAYQEVPCAGTGQDGEKQNGAARSYTVNGDGTITDNHSGLQWEVLTNPGDGSIHDVSAMYDWPGAFQKVADLDAANFAGHDDWRLPNVNELHALVDYGRNQPAINPVFHNSVDSFTPENGDAYWSSTTLQLGFPDRAWTVNFSGRGASVYIMEKWRSAFFRAVRGGRP